MNYGIQTKAESIAMRANHCSKTNKSLSTSKICGRKTPQSPSRWALEGGLRLPMGQRWESREEREILLFGDKNTLLLYSFMYGPNWDNPCPSCTSLVDGFDRTWLPGHSRRRVCRNCQSPGRSNQCVGQTTWMVADCAGFRIGLCLSGRLQMPGRL